MDKSQQADDVVIHDGAQRRRFMRQGATFVAAAGIIGVSAGRSALASDCDRGGAAEEKPEQAGNGSDSDRGANADPTGCGRHQEDKPKISKAEPISEPGVVKHISVAKITG